MTNIRTYFAITAAWLMATNSLQLAAQTAPSVVASNPRILAAPFQVVDAQIRNIPSSFMQKPGEAETGQLIEVLDLGIKVSSRELERFPPSLQPFLHIGSNTYPIQRVEYSNWDTQNEKPIDENVPVGDTQTVHFFIKNWQTVERNQPMILTVHSAEQIRLAVNGSYTVEQFNSILPELKETIPRYAPQNFIKLKQEN